MRLHIVAAGVAAAWLAPAAPGSTAEPRHPAPTVTPAAANPVTTAHSGSSQTGSVVLASVAPAVAVAAPGVAVLRRRTT